jgi:hypothetical protein
MIVTGNSERRVRHLKAEERSEPKMIPFSIEGQEKKCKDWRDDDDGEEDEEAAWN